MTESEVARIKRCIEQECVAMHLTMHGYTVVGNHDAINHKYEAIGNYQEQLEKIVCPDEAARIAVEIYQKATG